MIRSVLHALGSAAFLLAVAAGMLYAYLYADTRDAVERLGERLSPFASTHFDSVHVSLAGELGLRGVSIRPHGSEAVLHIDEVVLQAHNPVNLLRVRRHLAQGRIPERVGLQLAGLVVDLSGNSLARLLGDFEAEGGAVNQAFLLSPHLQCRGDAPLGVSSLKGMGLARLHASVDVQTRYGAGERIVSAEQRVENLVSNRLELRFAPGVDLLDQLYKRDTLSQITYASLSYRDRGAVAAINEYCARISRVSRREFVEANVARLIGAVAREGGLLPPSLVGAYRSLLTASGSAELEVRPTRPIRPSYLRFYRAADWSALLDARVAINGRAVPEVALLALEPEPEPGPSSTGQPAPVAQPRPLLSLQPVAVEDLARHLRADARITTVDGKVHDVELLDVGEEFVEVAMRTRRGSLGYSIAKSMVESAAVWLQQ